MEDNKCLFCESDAKPLGGDRFKCTSDYCGVVFTESEGTGKSLAPAEFVVGETYRCALDDVGYRVDYEILVKRKDASSLTALFNGVANVTCELRRCEGVECFKIPGSIPGTGVTIFPYNFVMYKENGEVA